MGSLLTRFLLLKYWLESASLNFFVAGVVSHDLLLLPFFVFKLRDSGSEIFFRVVFLRIKRNIYHMVELQDFIFADQTWVPLFLINFLNQLRISWLEIFSELWVAVMWFITTDVRRGIRFIRNAAASSTFLLFFRWSYKFYFISAIISKIELFRLQQ